VTAVYENATPLITAKFKITLVNGMLVSTDSPFQSPVVKGQIFDITIISGQNWMIFASEPISLSWKDNVLRASKPLNGEWWW